MPFTARDSRSTKALLTFLGDKKKKKKKKGGGGRKEKKKSSAMTGAKSGSPSRKVKGK